MKSSDLSHPAFQQTASQLQSAHLTVKADPFLQIPLFRHLSLKHQPKATLIQFFQEKATAFLSSTSVKMQVPALLQKNLQTNKIHRFDIFLLFPCRLPLQLYVLFPQYFQEQVDNQ